MMNTLELQMPSSNRREVGLAMLDLARDILAEDSNSEGTTYTATVQVPSPCIMKPKTKVDRNTEVVDNPNGYITLAELATVLTVEDMAEITVKVDRKSLPIANVVGAQTLEGIQVTANGEDLGVYVGDYVKKHRERKTDREVALLGGDVTQEIIHLYTEGMAVKGIQEEIGKSAGYIYSVLNNNQVPKRNKVGKASVESKLESRLRDQEFVSNVITDYEGGLPLDILYPRYGLYKNALYYILDRYSVPRRTRK